MPILKWVFIFFVSGFVYAAEDKAASGEAALTSKDQREYREKSLKLLGLEAKIKDLDSQLTGIVELKKKEKSPEKVRALMDDLVLKTKERNQMAADHRSLKKELLYRFPNLGEAIHRKYGVHEETSIEQLEKSGSLNELLDESKELIQTKYAPILKDSKDSKDDSGEIAAPLPKKKEEPLKLVK